MTAYEKKLKANREWKARNRKRLAQYSRDWRSENRERHRAYSKGYYETHREQCSETSMRWVRNNRDKHRVIQKNYKYRRRRGAEGYFTYEDWQRIVDHQQSRCIDCGEKVKLTVGHAIPLSRGGHNDISNIIAQCASCNSSQGTKIHPFAEDPISFGRLAA